MAAVGFLVYEIHIQPEKVLYVADRTFDRAREPLMPLRFFYTARRHQDRHGQYHLHFEVRDARGPGVGETSHSVHPDPEEAERALKLAIDGCRVKLKKRWGQDCTLEPAPSDGGD